MNREAKPKFRFNADLKLMDQFCGALRYRCYVYRKEKILSTTGIKPSALRDCSQ